MNAYVLFIFFFLKSLKENEICFVILTIPILRNVENVPKCQKMSLNISFCKLCICVKGVMYLCFIGFSLHNIHLIYEKSNHSSSNLPPPLLKKMPASGLCVLRLWGGVKLIFMT